MPTELEVSKRNLFSQYHSLEKSDNSLFIEDCRFHVFTELLYDAEIIDSPPKTSRKKGIYKRSNWSLIGYCFQSILVNESDDDDELENESEELEENKSEEKTSSKTIKWQYTIINGFFSEDLIVENAMKEEIDRSVREVKKFIEATLDRSFVNDVSEALDLQQDIYSAFKNDLIDQIEILIVTDKIISQDDLVKKVDVVDGLSVNVKYWDLKKWNDLKRSKSKRLPIAIDLTEDDYKSYHLDFVKRTANKNLSQYLVIFPGNLIADLYDYHNTKLLENNVRVFLSANRKANREIRKTIANDATKFFSFNNGISATAENIKIENGKILKIEDFQIVNGGQTTATIHYSRKQDKSDLTNVFVPVKITELKRDEDYGETVGNISKAANTQSAIRTSDFYANKPLLVQFERFSQKNPSSDENGSNYYYFFERMSGQYNVAKNSISTRKRLINSWIREHPKELSFTKIEIARWYNCLEGYPHIAALSAEKQFTLFMDEKNYQNPKINFPQFKHIVGYGMLFNRIRKLIGSKHGKEYPSIIGDSSVGMASAIYASSYLNKLTNGLLDYWSIYELKYNLIDSLIEKKRMDTDLDEVLIILIKETWEQLKNYGGTSVQEQTKKEGCWAYFQSNFRKNEIILRKVKPFLISKEELDHRLSDDVNNEDEIYFKGLERLLENRGSVLNDILEISSRESTFRDKKTKVNNLIKKIESKSSLIPRKRIEEIVLFYEELKGKGIKFDQSKSLDIPDLNYSLIFTRYFKDFNEFKERAENKILEDDEERFNENSKAYDKVIDIIEKLEREYGLSLEDLEDLNSEIDKF